MKEVLVDREVRLFWSGGWDSTFRLLQLSQEDGLSIRPMYIRDRDRKGMPFELSAMSDILQDVRGIAKARVLDVELYDRGTIARDFPDDEISTAYARLADGFRLGYQYELFALLCKGLGVRVECAVENSQRSKAKAAIDAQCRLVACEEERLGAEARYRVVSKGESTDAELVFGHLDFGMLGVSKVEAQQVAEQNGWMPIMCQTWFCHAPVAGEPCGICNPCRDAMNEGMRWRVPLSARLRYHAWRLRSEASHARGSVFDRRRLTW
jgi:7-cyano-7-deazaguanine synthase